MQRKPEGNCEGTEQLRLRVSTSAVMVTTFFSAFTLTIWLYVIRTMGLI